MMMLPAALAPTLATLHAQASPPTSDPSIVVTVVAFMLMLVVLVFFHELGHLLAALWMGIKVDEFGIGFPPRALTLFEHRGVRYSLNWIPLGGFVRFGGEGDNAVYGTGSLAEASPWRKIPVMAAGPLMNLLLAMLIFGGLFAFNGMPNPTGNQLITAVYPGSPAEEAGLEAGDVVARLDDQSVAPRVAISEIASANVGTPISIVVQRDGNERALTVEPGPWVLPAAEGGAEGDPNEAVERQGLGISYAPETILERVNPLLALFYGIGHTFTLLGVMISGLGQMVGGLLGLNEPPPGGLTGPVGIARATGEVIGEAGIEGFWNWTAILSVNLFLLNLLPIPALDGSHIVFSLIEWLRGGKKVPPDKEALVHAIGFASLMALIVLISVSDVMNAINGIPVLGQ